MIEETIRKRFVALACAIALGFVVVAIGLGRVVLFQGGRLAGMARRQHNQRLVLRQQRGTITDRHGNTMASSTKAPSIFARPPRIRAEPALAEELGGRLGLPARIVENKLRSDRPFVWLKRAVTPRQAEAVSGLELAGVGIEEEERRYYPHGTLAAHVLGFTGIDLQGLAGAELRFDEVLRGSPVFETVARDALGRAIMTGSEPPQRARRGASLEMTIDAPLQFVAEQALLEGVRRAGAKGGSVIVLDPATGEVLAMGNVPTFDPNSAERAPLDSVRNRAISDMYEPGSTLKPFLVAAALETGQVSSESVIYCEEGRMRVGRRTIHDHHPHGWLSVPEIIKVSSNIGVAKIAQKLGAPAYHEYLRRFGFGARLGIDLPAEAPGMLAPPDRWSPIRTVNAAFGQGIAVTPLQMAAAFGALANGGCLMRPHVVRRMIAADGQVLWEAKPQSLGCPIGAGTARKLTEMLEEVVERGGTAEKAAVDGIGVAGKTGTAQKVDPATGRYSTRAVVASFGGYLPSRAARVVIFVVIDEPSRGRFGGVVAAPVFRQIALEAMRRLQVAPATFGDRELRSVRASDTPAEPGAAVGMPSFIGMSLRRALVSAAEAGWQVKVKGRGYVRTQVPSPGAPASPGRVLVLSLAPPVDVP